MKYKIDTLQNLVKKLLEVKIKIGILEKIKGDV